MKLRYITISLSNDYPARPEYKYEFNCHSQYLCHFLSKAIRKYKIEVEGAYNMIHIEIGREGEPLVYPHSKFIEIYIPFCKLWYEKVRGTEDSSYYLYILNLGLKKAFEYSNVSLCYLDSLIKEFTDANGVNEWIHRKKTFKDIGLKAEMVCRFTTNHFNLSVRLINVKTKTLISEIPAICSYPDETTFEYCFLNIIYLDNRLWITDFQNAPYLYLEIENLQSSNLKFYYSDEYIADKQYFNLLVKNTSIKDPFADKEAY